MERPGEKDLVRVQSESELRPGFIWLLSCGECEKSHSIVLTRRYPQNCRCYDHGRCPDPWETTGDCAPRDDDLFSKVVCLQGAIDEGIVYRLRNLDDRQQQTTEKQREAVR